MLIFYSEKEYIDSCTGLQAKIAACDAVIDALFTTALKAAATDDVSEYWLNDGQTQIKKIYKGTYSVERSISLFQKLRQGYINRLYGRGMRLMDSQNFR
jgi:hypothetical protein